MINYKVNTLSRDLELKTVSAVSEHYQPKRQVLSRVLKDLDASIMAVWLMGPSIKDVRS